MKWEGIDGKGQNLAIDKILDYGEYTLQSQGV